jgi:hypothetical protein
MTTLIKQVHEDNYSVYGARKVHDSSGGRVIPSPAAPSSA